MKEQNPTSRAHECSILGCPQITVLTKWADPRERWMLDVPLKDDDGMRIISLCPVHAREIFLIEESDYVALERAERLVVETVGQRPS